MGVEVLLKNRMKTAGLRPREIADRLNKKYSTVVSWLNGYTELPRDVRARIEAILNERETEKNLSKAEIE